MKNFNTFALKPIPAVALGLLPLGAWAAPMGAEVIAGQASIQQQGLNTLVQQSSQSAVVNWQQFNVGGQELVRFQQPNSASVILNRIVGGSPSEILGQLQANGRVFITNPNGVVFGRSAQVDVGSLAVSTANISTADFMAGNYVFVGSNPQASIVNQGVIHSQSGGFAILNAPQVENAGLIQAQLGDVVLAGASGMALDLDGSGLVNFSLSGAPAEALVSARNSGALQAGTVQITAQAAQQIAQSVVNNSGTVRAQSIEQRGGEIYLTGGHIQQTGTLDASGATQGGTVRSIATGTLESRGTTNVRGGQSGGLVEVSGHQTLVLQENLEIGRGGRLLIDPANLTLVEGPNQGAADTIYEEEVENQLRTGTSVQLVASDSITVNDLSDGAIDGSAGGSGGSLLLGIGSVDMAGNFFNGTGIGNGNITFLDTNDTVLLDGRFQASAGTVSGNLTLGGVNADGGIVLNGAGNVVFDNLISSNNFNEVFINSFNGSVQGQLVDSNAGITSFSVAGLNIANINVQGSVNLFGDGGNVQVNNLQQSSQGTGSLELNISSNALVDLGSYTYNQGVDALSAIISGGNGVSIGSFVADTQGKPDIDSSQRLILNGIFATHLRVNAGNGDVNIGTLNLRTNLNNEQTSNFYSGQNPGTFIDEFGQGAGIQTELIANSGSINVSNYIASAHGENRLFVNSNLRGGALSSINFGNANLSSQRSTYRVSQIDSSGNIIDTHETQMGLAQVSLGYAHTITTGNGGGLVINANQANVDIRGGVINLNSNGSKTPLSISPLSNPDQYNYIIGNNLQPTASVTAMGSAQVNLVADATGAEPQILIGADSSSQGLVVEGRQTEVNLRANHIQINGDIELTALGVSANGDFSNTPGFDRSQLGNNNLLIENGSFLLGSNRLIMTGPTGGGPANQVNLPINLTANAVGSNEVIIESNNVGSLFSNAANYNLNAAQGFRAGLFSQIDVNNEYRIERTFLDTNGAGSGSTFSSNELRVLNPNSLGAVNFGEVLLLGGRNTLEVSSLSPVFFNGGVTLTDGGTVNNLSEQAVFLPIQGAPSRPNATTNIVGGTHLFVLNYDPSDTSIPSIPVSFGDNTIRLDGTGDAIVAINAENPTGLLMQGNFSVSALQGSYATNDPTRLSAAANINTGRVVFHLPGSGQINGASIGAVNGLSIGGNIESVANPLSFTNSGSGGLSNIIFGDLLTEQDPLSGFAANFVSAPITDLSLGNVRLATSGALADINLIQDAASAFTGGSLSINTLGSVRFNALSTTSTTTFGFSDLTINAGNQFSALGVGINSQSMTVTAGSLQINGGNFTTSTGALGLVGTGGLSSITSSSFQAGSTLELSGLQGLNLDDGSLFSSTTTTLNGGTQGLQITNTNLVSTGGELLAAGVVLDNVIITADTSAFNITAGAGGFSADALRLTSGTQNINSTGGININDSRLDASGSQCLLAGNGGFGLRNTTLVGTGSTVLSNNNSGLVALEAVTVTNIGSINASFTSSSVAISQNSLFNAGSVLSIRAGGDLNLGTESIFISTDAASFQASGNIDTSASSFNHNGLLLIGNNLSLTASINAGEFFTADVGSAGNIALSGNINADAFNLTGRRLFVNSANNCGLCGGTLTATIGTGGIDLNTQVSLAGAINLNTAGSLNTGTFAMTASGNSSIVAGNGLAVNNNITVSNGNLILDAGMGLFNANAASLSSNGLSIKGNGVTLGETTIETSNGALAISAGNAALLINAGGSGFAGTTINAGNVNLLGNDLNISAGTVLVSSGNVVANAGAGMLVINGDSNISAAGDLSFIAGNSGDIRGNTLAAGGALTVQTGNGLFIGDGDLTATNGLLTLAAGGAALSTFNGTFTSNGVALSGTGINSNAVDFLSGTGSFSANAATGGIILSNTDVVSGDQSFSSNGLNINGFSDLKSSGNLIANAGTGALSLNGGNTIEVAGNALFKTSGAGDTRGSRLTAGGALSILTDSGLFAGDANLTASNGLLTLAAGNGLLSTFNGTFTANGTALSGTGVDANNVTFANGTAAFDANAGAGGLVITNTDVVAGNQTLAGDGLNISVGSNLTSSGNIQATLGTGGFAINTSVLSATGSVTLLAMNGGDVRSSTVTAGNGVNISTSNGLQVTSSNLNAGTGLLTLSAGNGALNLSLGNYTSVGQRLAGNGITLSSLLLNAGSGHFAADSGQGSFSTDNLTLNANNQSVLAIGAVTINNSDLIATGSQTVSSNGLTIGGSSVFSSVDQTRFNTGTGAIELTDSSYTSAGGISLVGNGGNGSANVVRNNFSAGGDLQISAGNGLLVRDSNLSSGGLLSLGAGTGLLSALNRTYTAQSMALSGNGIGLDNLTLQSGQGTWVANAGNGTLSINNTDVFSGNQTLTAGTLNLSTVSLAATGSQSLNSTGGINIDDSNLDANTAIGITSGSGLLLLTNSSVAGSNINISGVSSSLINTSLTANALGVAVSGQQGLSLSNVEVTGNNHRLSSSAGAIQVVSSDIQGNGLTVEGDGIVTLEESVITTDNQSYTSRTTNAANAQSGSVRFLNNTSLAGDRLVVSGGLGVQLDQASLEFNSASFSSPSQASFTTSTVSANTLALNFAGLVALDAVTFNTNDAFTLAGTQVDWSNTLLNGTPSLVLNAAGISFSGTSSAGFASTQITGLQSFNNSGEALALGSANQALTLNVEGALNLGNAVLTGSSINLNGSNVVLDGNAFNTRVLNLNGSNSVSVSNVTYDLDRFTVAAPSFTASNSVLTHAQALTLQNNVINLNNVTVNAPSLTLSGSSVRFANSRFVSLVRSATLGLKADGYDVDMQASMDLDLSGSQLQGQNIRLRSGQSVLLQGSTVTAGGQLLINASREINGNGQAISNLSAEGLTFSATDILLSNTRLNIGNGQALLGNDASSLAELAEEAPNLLPLVSSPNGALVASNRLVLGSVAGNMDYLYLSAVDTGFAQAITGSSDLFIHVVPGNNEAIVVDNLDVFASATTVLIGSQGYTGNILIDANANKVVAGATDTNFVFLSQGSTVGESSISTNGQVLVLNRAPVQIEPTPEQIMALNSAPIYDRSQYQSSDERGKIEDQRQEEETDRREESSNTQVGGINEESSGRIESQTSARVAQQCYAQ